MEFDIIRIRFVGNAHSHYFDGGKYYRSVPPTHASLWPLRKCDLRNYTLCPATRMFINTDILCQCFSLSYWNSEGRTERILRSETLKHTQKYHQLTTGNFLTGLTRHVFARRDWILLGKVFSELFRSASLGFYSVKKKQDRDQIWVFNTVRARPIGKCLCLRIADRLKKKRQIRIGYVIL